MQTARVIPLIPDNAPLSLTISPDHPWVVQGYAIDIRGSSVTLASFIPRDETGMKRDEAANPGKSGLGEGLLTKLKQLVTHC